LEEHKAVPLIGKKIGETIDGTALGLRGYKLLITGGTDKDGFPMHPTIHGGIRKSILLKKGVGFNPKREGQRKRKTLRGNVITEEIVQINMKILEKPKQTMKKKEEAVEVQSEKGEEEAQPEKAS
jgi:small subunit ribosomal protein S6e